MHMDVWFAFSTRALNRKVADVEGAQVVRLHGEEDLPTSGCGLSWPNVSLDVCVAKAT